MRCSKCGTDYDPTDKFCRNCGRPIVHPGGPATDEQADSGATAEVLDGRTRLRIKKLRIISITIVIAALVLVLLAQVAPGILNSVGLTPKDLDVKWTDADLSGILNKSGIKTDDPPTGTDRSAYTNVYTGQKDVDWTFTQEEISAWLNAGKHPGYWPFANMQVKILPGNIIEASMSLNPAVIMTWPEVTDNLPNEVKSFLKQLPVNVPLYVKGKVDFTGAKQVDVHLQEAVAAGFSIPNLANDDQANQILENIINTTLGKIEQVNVSGFSTVDGSLTLKGTWYEEQKRVPAN